MKRSITDFPLKINESFELLSPGDRGENTPKTIREQFKQE
jgi:hypothetical protein